MWQVWENDKSQVPGQWEGGHWQNRHPDPPNLRQQKGSEPRTVRTWVGGRRCVHRRRRSHRGEGHDRTSCVETGNERDFQVYLRSDQFLWLCAFLQNIRLLQPRCLVRVSWWALRVSGCHWRCSPVSGRSRWAMVLPVLLSVSPFCGLLLVRVAVPTVTVGLSTSPSSRSTACVPNLCCLRHLGWRCLPRELTPLSLWKGPLCPW